MLHSPDQTLLNAPPLTIQWEEHPSTAQGSATFWNPSSTWCNPSNLHQTLSHRMSCFEKETPHPAQVLHSSQKSASNQRGGPASSLRFLPQKVSDSTWEVKGYDIGIESNVSLKCMLYTELEIKSCTVNFSSVDYHGIWSCQLVGPWSHVLSFCWGSSMVANPEASLSQIVESNHWCWMQCAALGRVMRTIASTMTIGRP